jgi:small subunit ribosomal protein S6e
LTKEDDVRKYVIRRDFEKKGKKVSKAPKIQRLVTPLTLQHKRQRAASKKAALDKSKAAKAEYESLFAQRLKEAKSRRASSIAKRRSSRRASGADAAAAGTN